MLKFLDLSFNLFSKAVELIRIFEIGDFGWLEEMSFKGNPVVNGRNWSVEEYFARIFQGMRFINGEEVKRSEDLAVNINLGNKFIYENPEEIESMRKQYLQIWSLNYMHQKEKAFLLKKVNYKIFTGKNIKTNLYRVYL